MASCLPSWPAAASEVTSKGGARSVRQSGAAVRSLQAARAAMLTPSGYRPAAQPPGAESPRRGHSLSPVGAGSLDQGRGPLLLQPRCWHGSE